MCPIIHIIALALADKAFKKNYSTVDAVYRAEIPVDVKQISLKWKTDVMDLALFRSVAKRQPTSEALSYHSLATNWRKLVSDAGFEAPPSFYAIRRDTANVLNSTYLQSCDALLKHRMYTDRLQISHHSQYLCRLWVINRRVNFAKATSLRLLDLTFKAQFLKFLCRRLQ